MIKIHILIVTVLSFVLVYSLAEARGGGSHVRVKSYTARSGKYVSPHYRTSGDNSKSNNWSTKGNVNPYTGKKGYKRLK